MSEQSTNEIANRAIADAVRDAVQENPEIDGEKLSALAVNVAKAICAGFAVVTSSGEPVAPRS